VNKKTSQTDNRTNLVKSEEREMKCSTDDIVSDECSSLCCRHTDAENSRLQRTRRQDSASADRTHRL